jgi:hypothetical protein
MPEEKFVEITLKLDEETMGYIDRVSDLARVSRNDMINILIAMKMEDMREKNKESEGLGEDFPRRQGEGPHYYIFDCEACNIVQKEGGGDRGYYIVTEMCNGVSIQSQFCPDCIEVVERILHSLGVQYVKKHFNCYGVADDDE